MSKGYNATFKVGNLSDYALSALLDALFAIDCEQLLANPGIPALYQSGVRYVDPGDIDDPWCDVLTTYAAKEGDCEDLACWRAAELRVRLGVMASPCFVRRILPEGGQRIHILVRLPGNRYEDPSRVLGMR